MKEKNFIPLHIMKSDRRRFEAAGVPSPLVNGGYMAFISEHKIEAVCGDCVFQADNKTCLSSDLKIGDQARNIVFDAKCQKKTTDVDITGEFDARFSEILTAALPVKPPILPFKKVSA